MAKHVIKIEVGSVEYLDYTLDGMVESGLVRTYSYEFTDDEKIRITFFYDIARKEEFFKFLRVHIFKTEAPPVNIFGEILAAIGCFSIPFLGVLLVGLLA